MNFKIVAFLTLLSVGFSGLATSAQNLKFGKPTADEWALTSCSEAPDAPAVVLCKTMHLTYDFVPNFSAYGNVTELSQENVNHGGKNQYINTDGASMLYTVKMRIKILKPEGTPYANLDIIYFNEDQSLEFRDEFYSFSIVVFENVNGKIKKKRLDKSYTDGRIDHSHMIRHVRLPEVKQGDIVEVQFVLFSKRIPFIYGWQFQEEKIPVRYSKCELIIPYFLQFKVNAAIRDNVKTDVTRGQILLKQEISDFQAPKKCLTNDYTVIAHDVLPWNIDPIREKRGTAMAQLLTKIDYSGFREIPYPKSLPSGLSWISINPE